VGLRRTLLRQGAHAEALALFDAQVRLTARNEDKAALLYEKGRLLEDRLEKKAEARAAYEAALELAPGDGAILRAVARCQRRAHAWGALDRSLEQLAQVSAAEAPLRATRPWPRSCSSRPSTWPPGSRARCAIYSVSTRVTGATGI
jgi:tetratricopeptide (TPR) repeat protein